MSPSILRTVSVIMLVTCALATGVPGAEIPGRTSLEREILGLLREGRKTEALPLCRDYVDRFPGDAYMLYNLACLENGAGDEEAAAEAFGRALAAGFEDFDHALTDPDLAGVAAVKALIADESARLAGLAARRGTLLVYGEWTPDLVLADRAALPGAEPGEFSDPVLRLGWQPTGLDIELEAGPDWALLGTDDSLAPANGGPGLFVSLAIPDRSRPFSSTNHFLFSFGAEKGSALGAMFIVEQRRWQRIAELDPKIRIDEAGRYHLKALVPWQAIMPFHPLVDAPLGINAGLTLGAAGPPVLACLLQAQDLLDPTAAARRFVPVDVAAETVPDETFLGRVSDSISGDLPLAVDLVAVAPAAGPATLTLDFLDGFGQSVMPTGALNERVDLVRGPNRFTRQADFRALETGTYMLKAEIAFASGATAVWSTAILHLADGWEGRFASRIDLLTANEAPTARFYLDTVIDAVDNHPVRRNPKAIGRTLTDLVTLLDGAETTGTILPDKGVFLMVYPGPDGGPRLASLYLPPARDLAVRLNPVLVLNPAPGSEGRIAGRIGRNYEHGDLTPTLKGDDETGFPVYVVPRLEALEPGGDPDRLAEAAACLDWALATFGAETAAAVGIDATGGAALELAVARPEALNHVLVFAGQNLDPWPQAPVAFLGEKLAPLRAGPPLTWVDFEAETARAGQAADLLAALRDQGVDLGEVESVRGGLSLTQAADRTVRWAEGIR